MRSIRSIAALVVVASCTLCALASPAFAVKEKKVFGEWQAEVVGQNLETTPVPLLISKEGSAELTGLQIGPYHFGPVNKEGDVVETEPCLKTPKISGEFLAEPGKVNRSSSLTIHIGFRQCVTRSSEHGATEEKNVHFTISAKLEPNMSAEIGKASGAEIEETEVTFKGALRKCPIVIPRQTVPFKDDMEKEYEEVVAYSNESEPVEPTKKNKERYPNGNKERVEVEFGEKFRGIRAYLAQEVENENTHAIEHKGCHNTRGTENPRLITSGKYKGWLEYTNGHIFGDFTGLEAKNGELRFVEPI